MVERPKDQRGCKSPKHEPGCPCTMCNRSKEVCNKCPKISTQHEIPRCIGRKILGMSSKELDQHTHKESKPCHRENDVRVPMVYEEMRLRKNTDHILFSATAVLKMREVGYFRG